MTRICTFLLAGAFAFLVRSVLAQAPVTEEKEAEVPTAHVRCWIFPTDNVKATTLVARAADKTEHELASVQGSAHTPTAYTALSPGAYVLDLKLGDRSVSSAAIQIKDGTYHTIAVVPKGSALELVPYFDGPRPDKSAPRPVRVFNFAAGRSTVLYPGSARPSKVPAGSVAELQLPPSVMPFRVEVLASNGSAPATSTVELDLKRTPSAYVVVSADYRGRMRPRVLSGGGEE